MRHGMKMMALEALALGLGACAGPRWQTVYQYEPPAGPQAQTCTQRCIDHQQSCRVSCEDRHQQCLYRAEINARDSYELSRHHYAREMQAWQIEYALYESDWRRHEHQRERLEYDQRHYGKRCKDDPRDRTACELAERAKRELRSLSSHRPYPPSRPYTPSLSDEIAEAQSRCTRDCGCIETYNACYASCGGRVVPQQRCIDNCPDGIPRFEPVTE